MDLDFILWLIDCDYWLDQYTGHNVCTSHIDGWLNVSKRGAGGGTCGLTALLQHVFHMK